MHPTHTPTSSADHIDDPAVVVTPADTMRGAARYLSRHGLHQGTYYPRPDQPTEPGYQPFPPACVVGALAMAAYGRRHESLYYGGDDQGRRDLGRAVDAFAADLARLEPTIVLTSDQAIDIDGAVMVRPRAGPAPVSAEIALRAMANCSM